MEKDPKKVKAAKARSESLSSESRSEIAKRAAAVRWDKHNNIPQSQHSGELKIGNMIFQCDVLSDETRVITQSDFMNGMGMYYSGWISKNRSEDELEANIPQFLAMKSLRPFVQKHLGDFESITLDYRTKNGNIAKGIRADTIPHICEVWLDADDEISLGTRQKIIAKNAKEVIRALAKTGIIALVDEATKYQDVRAKDALAKIFEEFLTNDRQKWARTFPIDFYREIYRLRGWKFEPWNTKRPGVIAAWTNDFIYDRLAPGITEELNRKNPIGENGHRAAKHHMYFDPDKGHPKLKEHISGVIALLKASDTWSGFRKSLDRVYPKYTLSSQLDLDYDV